MADRRHCVAAPLPCLKHRNYRCIAWRTGVAGSLASIPAKKRANRNKSLDISEATRRESRRTAPRRQSRRKERDEEERETGTATETQELFLFTSELISSGYCIWISERSDGTQRGEPRWMRESAEHTAWNFNATFQALLPPRWSILFFLHFRDCSCQPPTPHTLTHARISSLSRAESQRNFKLKD